MVICVIGGAGFVGRRVVRNLAASGHDVVCLDISSANPFADLKTKVRMGRVDVSDFEGVLNALKAHQPSVVVNLTYMIGDHAPRAAFKVNVLGMDNVFEAARLCGIERVLFATSNGVYNAPQRHWGMRKLSEDDPTAASKQYSVHKVFNEWQAREYREKHGMTITDVRVGNVAGLDKLVGSVEHVECVVKPAKGERASFPYRDTMRCVIHVEDIADVLARVATGPKPRHPIYNSGGETLSLGDIAGMVRKVIPDADIHFENDTGGEAKSAAYLIDNSRLVSEYGVSYMPYEKRVAQMIDEVRRLR